MLGALTLRRQPGLLLQLNSHRSLNAGTGPPSNQSIHAATEAETPRYRLCYANTGLGTSGPSCLARRFRSLYGLASIEWGPKSWTGAWAYVDPTPMLNNPVVDNVGPCSWSAGFLFMATSPIFRLVTPHRLLVSLGGTISCTLLYI